MNIKPFINVNIIEITIREIEIKYAIILNHHGSKNLVLFIFGIDVFFISIFSDEFILNFFELSLSKRDFRL